MVATGLEHPGLGGGQKLAQDLRVMSAGAGELEGKPEINAEDLTRRADADVVLHRLDDLPGLVLFVGLRRVLAVGAALSRQADAAFGAGRALLFAAPAVPRPSARLEVPAAEGPDAFFAALSSTWRRVNSWKNRSPTG